MPKYIDMCADVNIDISSLFSQQQQQKQKKRTDKSANQTERERDSTAGKEEVENGVV